MFVVIYFTGNILDQIENLHFDQTKSALNILYMIYIIIIIIMILYKNDRRV